MARSELTRNPSRFPYAAGGRRMDAALRRAQVPGQLTAASIEGAAFAAHVGLSHAAMLSAAEGRAIEYAPLGEGRYKAIVDTFAGVTCDKLSLLVHQ